MNILSDGIAVLNDDVQRLSTESIRYQHALQPLTQDFSKLKISIQEQNSFLDAMKVTQEVLQQDIESMRQKVNDIKTCSCDGTFIWRITNVQEKIGQRFMFFLIGRTLTFLENMNFEVLTFAVNFR